MLGLVVARVEDGIDTLRKIARRRYIAGADVDRPVRDRLDALSQLRTRILGARMRFDVARDDMDRVAGEHRDPRTVALDIAGGDRRIAGITAIIGAHFNRVADMHCHVADIDADVAAVGDRVNAVREEAVRRNRTGIDLDIAGIRIGIDGVGAVAGAVDVARDDRDIAGCAMRRHAAREIALGRRRSDRDGEVAGGPRIDAICAGRGRRNPGGGGLDIYGARFIHHGERGNPGNRGLDIQSIP